VFFALYGRVTLSLFAQIKGNQKKEHPHACPTGSLRCSIEPAGRRDVKLGLRPQTAHPETSGSICASRQAWTGYRVNIKGNIVGAPSRRDCFW